MGYDATGNYTRTHNFSADGSAGIKILASRMDAEYNDVASAMSLPLLKDGRNAATGNIPMGGFRHVNVGAPASATNYIRAKDFIENIPIYMVDAEASPDRISVSRPFSLPLLLRLLLEMGVMFSSRQGRTSHLLWRFVSIELNQPPRHSSMKLKFLEKSLI